MAAIPLQQPVYPSFAPLFAAAANGDTCVPGDRNYLWVKNGGGTSINVTVTSFPDTLPWGGAAADLVVAVPNGQERWIGPLRGTAHADPATGVVGIAYSALTSVTTALVMVP